MTPESMMQEKPEFIQGRQNVTMNQEIEKERQLILNAKKKGGLALFSTYVH